MKVLIVEDEKIAADRLSRLLNNLVPDLELLSHLDSVDSTVDWFKSNEEPDLLFLDIQLADGLSFEIFEKLVIKCPVIFTTAYSEYAIKAFKVNSVDYLLKPISEGDLKSALDKYQSRAIPTVEFSALSDLLAKNKDYKERFIIKVGEHLKAILTRDVELFYSQEKATYLHSESGKHFIIDYTLDQIEEMIDPRQFFRVNRKQIVDIDGIEDIISYSSSRLKIVMKNYAREEIIVARDRVAAFKSWLDR